MSADANPGSYLAPERVDWYASECQIVAGIRPIETVDSQVEPATAANSPGSVDRHLIERGNHAA